MAVEVYLGRSRLFQRLKNGPHGHLVELYAARIVGTGLKQFKRANRISHNLKTDPGRVIRDMARKIGGDPW
jgi:hypothetical protein